MKLLNIFLWLKKNWLLKINYDQEELQLYFFDIHFISSGLAETI